MTVITKLSAEQKGQETKGSAEPLVQEAKANVDVEVAAAQTRRRWGAVRILTHLLLFLFLLATAILAGIYVHKQILLRKNGGRFHGWCRVPVDTAEAKPRIRLLNDDLDPSSDDQIMLNDPFQLMKMSSDADSSTSRETSSSEINDVLLDIHSRVRQFLDEMIDIDANEENSVKIDVPKFGENRGGRFIHDFTFNYTVIIDADGGRCFVTPLDYDLVMPPTSFLDLLLKTVTGYYDRALSVVRETSRVVVPAIDDTDYLGPVINLQCFGYPIYKLERITSPMFKRSLDLATGGHFVEYTGNNLLELNIMNIDEAMGKPKSV